MVAEVANIVVFGALLGVFVWFASFLYSFRNGGRSMLSDIVEGLKPVRLQILLLVPIVSAALATYGFVSGSMFILTSGVCLFIFGMFHLLRDAFGKRH